jgi:hypothetical protein
MIYFKKTSKYGEHAYPSPNSWFTVKRNDINHSNLTKAIYKCIVNLDKILLI